MNNFSELSLAPVLKANLAKHGFTLPTPVQQQAIPPALGGQDVLATADTGTGKTLAFLIPLLESLLKQKANTGIQAVVLSPTRELAIQINEAFGKLAEGTKLHSAVVVGGLGEAQQLRTIRGGAQVVIATPGRLCDFLARRLVRLASVRFFVLDEADRMLDMGFLPSLRAICKELPAERQTLLFSATIEKSVAHLVKDYVRDPVRVAIGSASKPVNLVELQLFEVEQEQKAALLLDLLRTEEGAFLVFTRTKHGADRLARHLERAGVDAGRIHGNRSQSQRNQALLAFRNGTHRVLVATDVAARGIHVDGIAHVVNYDLPQVPEDFIHRVGRTGRAGARGVASSFSTRAERGDIRRIERAINVRLKFLPVPAQVMQAPPPTAKPTSQVTPSPKVIVMPKARAARARSARPRNRRAAQSR